MAEGSHFILAINQYLNKERTKRFPGLVSVRNTYSPDSTDEMVAVRLPDGSIYWVNAIYRKVKINPDDAIENIANTLLVDEAKILDYAARYGSHEDRWFALVELWHYILQPDGDSFAATTMALFRIAPDGGMEILTEQLDAVQQFVLMRGDEIIHEPPEHHVINIPTMPPKDNDVFLTGVVANAAIDAPESTDIPPPESERMTRFEKALEHLINVHSMENGSDTPDFLLAQYLRGCLENFNTVVKARSKWYGHGSSEIGEALGLDQPLNDPGDPIGAEHENKL